MNTTETSGITLKPKQHFEILDGLRGIAAFAVVVFHFMEWISDPSQNFIGHGFLAVDFFFCLSGFVIGYAYDDRISKMGLKSFFVSRIIRLHPLVIVGSVLGLLEFLFDPFQVHLELYSAGKIILTFICSIFLIPFPVLADRGFNLFSFNAPAWSLFWEYLANIVYAFILYKIKRNFLLFLTIISAFAICYVGYNSGNLSGGWSGPTFWNGCARISYSFLAGLLIYRSNWIIKNRFGFAELIILLLLPFFMPFSKWNWMAEPFVVLFYFPLLISLGAGAVLKPELKKACVLSGKISYPLYMMHYAFIWIFANYYTNYKPNSSQLILIVIVSVTLLVLFAYLVMIVYDIPLRNYLNIKSKKKLEINS